ncbi:MAG TPA: hypothetical protein VIG97_07345 [Luteimonas sp.]
MLSRLTFDTAPKELAEYVAARDAVAELVAADRELDAAQDALCEAKREKGQWRVNPLQHGHPAVIRVREAKTRRAAALNAIEGISA